MATVYQNENPYDLPPEGNTRGSNPSAPAYLSIQNLEFVDPSGNNRVEAEEMTYIEFDLINQGSGMARDMILKVSEQKLGSGLGYSQSRTLGDLNPGEQKAHSRRGCWWT